MLFSEIRDKFEQERKQEGFKVQQYRLFDTYKTKVVTLDKRYEEVYDRREELVLEGKLAIGAVVMANPILFDKRKPFDCPALFVYSFDTYYEENIEALEALAEQIYEIQDLTANELLQDRDKKYIADKLERHDEPIFNEMLPLSLTEGRVAYITSIIVARKYLGMGVLEKKIYPLIVKEDIKAGIILPCTYYDNNIVIRQVYHKRKRRQIIVPLLILIPTLVYVYKANYLIATIILILAGVFTLINWRCPKCNHFLGKGNNPSSCPKCSCKLK